MLYTQNDFGPILKTFWDRVLEAYHKGSRSPEELFQEQEILFMTDIGVTPYDIYDHVEDFVRYQEPDFLTFLLVMGVRRYYFLFLQKPEETINWVMEPDLPRKTDSYEGIVWLPRITAKAYAKIQGRLHPTLMYGCSGDRQFLKEYKLHAADFFSMVGTLGGNLPKVYNWLMSLKGHPCL